MRESNNKRVNPQGYSYGIDPQNVNPFWTQAGNVVGVTATASVLPIGGTPDVEVEQTTDPQTGNVNIDFTFSGLKGEPGQPGQPGAPGQNGADGKNGADGVTPDITITASALSIGGTTPHVSVTKSGTDEAPEFDFEFSGLGGGGSAEYPHGGQTGQALVKRSPADNDVMWGSILPVNGISGQYLKKTENGVAWGSIAPVSGIPSGGVKGQALVKDSNADGDVVWGSILPTGGIDGQYLQKTSEGVAWGSIAPVAGVPDGGTDGQILKVLQEEFEEDGEHYPRIIGWADDYPRISKNGNVMCVVTGEGSYYADGESDSEGYVRLAAHNLHISGSSISFDVTNVSAINAVSLSCTLNDLVGEIYSTPVITPAGTYTGSVLGSGLIRFKMNDSNGIQAGATKSYSFALSGIAIYSPKLGNGFTINSVPDFSGNSKKVLTADPDDPRNMIGWKDVETGITITKYIPIDNTTEITESMYYNEGRSYDITFMADHDGSTFDVATISLPLGAYSEWIYGIKASGGNIYIGAAQKLYDANTSKYYIKPYALYTNEPIFENYGDNSLYINDSSVNSFDYFDLAMNKHNFPVRWKQNENNQHDGFPGLTDYISGTTGLNDEPLTFTTDPSSPSSVHVKLTFDDTNSVSHTIDVTIMASGIYGARHTSETLEMSQHGFNINGPDYTELLASNGDTLGTDIQYYHDGGGNITATYSDPDFTISSIILPIHDILEDQGKYGITLNDNNGDLNCSAEITDGENTYYCYSHDNTFKVCDSNDNPISNIYLYNTDTSSTGYSETNYYDLYTHSNSES